MFPGDTDFRSFFQDRVSDLSTSDYLLDGDLTQHLAPLISANFEHETELLKARILRGPNPRSKPTDMRVVLTNIALDGFSGSELWTAEIARFLRSAGVEVIVFSNKLGKIAKRISDGGIAVTSSIEEIAEFSPTLLHVNHYEAVCELVTRLAGRTRIINMIHGLLPRPGLPGYSHVDRYCSASIASKAKVHALTGAPWADIDILPNFFDEDRFKSIGNPARIDKSLIFSSHTEPQHRDRLQQATRIEFDHIGNGATPTDEPERWLPQFDVVFAVGRSAIEALASGAHVVLWDAGICGPAVTPDNFWQCVTANFALAANVLPWHFINHDGAGEWATTEVSKISAARRIETTRLARTYLPLSIAGRRLLEVYEEFPREN